MSGVPIVALGPYADEMRAVVRAAKNFRSRAVIRTLQPDISAMFTDLARVPVIPVPPSRPGFIRRGYGLGAVVARYAPRHTVNALRMVDGGTQRGKSFAERSMGRRFIVAGQVPETAILVDDVLTTGATVASAIDALAAHGCRVVAVVVLAAVPRRVGNVTLGP